MLFAFSISPLAFLLAPPLFPSGRFLVPEGVPRRFRLRYTLDIPFELSSSMFLFETAKLPAHLKIRKCRRRRS